MDVLYTFTSETSQEVILNINELCDRIDTSYKTPLPVSDCIFYQKNLSLIAYISQEHFGLINNYLANYAQIHSTLSPPQV